MSRDEKRSEAVFSLSDSARFSCRAVGPLGVDFSKPRIMPGHRGIFLDPKTKIIEGDASTNGETRALPGKSAPQPLDVGAVEKLSHDFLCLEDFTRDRAGRAAVLFVVGVDLAHSLGDLA